MKTKKFVKIRAIMALITKNAKFKCPLNCVINGHAVVNLLYFQQDSTNMYQISTVCSQDIEEPYCSLTYLYLQ